MAKKLFLGFIIVTLLCSGTLVAKTKSPISPLGRPAFSSSQIPHFIIWQDFNGWHLRWMTLDSKHRFTGELKIKDGQFNRVKALYPYAEKKIFKLEAQRFRFNVVDDKKMNGIDFATTAQSIKFVLAIDGKYCTDCIFIGGLSKHPRDIPFKLKPVQHGFQNP